MRHLGCTLLVVGLALGALGTGRIAEARGRSRSGIHNDDRGRAQHRPPLVVTPPRRSSRTPSRVHHPPKVVITPPRRSSRTPSRVHYPPRPVVRPAPTRWFPTPGRHPQPVRTHRRQSTTSTRTRTQQAYWLGHSQGYQHGLRGYYGCPRPFRGEMQSAYKRGYDQGYREGRDARNRRSQRSSRSNGWRW